MIRFMLADLNLLVEVWPELLDTAVYLRLRTLNKYLRDTISFEILYKRKLDLSYLKMISCVC
jgi:hypothetical protein